MDGRHYFVVNGRVDGERVDSRILEEQIQRAVERGYLQKIFVDADLGEDGGNPGTSRSTSGSRAIQVSASAPWAIRTPTSR